MNENKVKYLKCGLRALASYTVINFLWTAIISLGTTAASQNAGTDVTNVSIEGISAFADRMVMANFAILFFSVVFGFSFLVFEWKNISQPAKRALHVIVNYITAMICVFLLHSTAPEAKASVWVVLIFFATLVYFAIYGVASLVSFLVKRRKSL